MSQPHLHVTPEAGNHRSVPGAKGHPDAEFLGREHPLDRLLGLECNQTTTGLTSSLECSQHGLQTEGWHFVWPLMQMKKQQMMRDRCPQGERRSA